MVFGVVYWISLAHFSKDKYFFKVKGVTLSCKKEKIYDKVPCTYQMPFLWESLHHES